MRLPLFLNMSLFHSDVYQPSQSGIIASGLCLVLLKLSSQAVASILRPVPAEAWASAEKVNDEARTKKRIKHACRRSIVQTNASTQWHESQASYWSVAFVS